MKFNWEYLTKKDYKNFLKAIKKGTADDDMMGNILVGDIDCNVVYRGESAKNENGIYVGAFWLDLYVAHEDTGYSYDSKIPYDYACGTIILVDFNMTYEEFKKKAENDLEEYFKQCDMENAFEYSLIEHANRPLEIWSYD